MTMIERVARALAKKERGKYPTPEGDESWGLWLGFARTAIDAMREPTETMIDAAHEDWAWGPGTNLDDTDADATRCWGTMIDAALKDQ